MAPCVPAIKLGRFQVNCPSQYLQTLAVPGLHGIKDKIKEYKTKKMTKYIILLSVESKK